MAGMIPSHVFLDVSLACNLRCIQCGIHGLKEPEHALAQSDRENVVRQLSDWDPSIRLVLTGGELLIDEKSLFDLATCCQKYCVYTTLSTNATLITPQVAARLAHSGIRCVVVSLDSHRPEIHDMIRGVPGTWKRAVEGLRHLVDARERADNGFSVLSSTILGAHNLHEMTELVEWLWAQGVDTTLFQPIQPDFARPEDPLWHAFSPLWPEDTDIVDEGIGTLIRYAEAGGKVYQQPYKFEDMKTYFHNPSGLLESICASFEENMMIDVVGQIRFCFRMDSLGLPVVGNVTETPLKELWNKRALCASRMNGCRHGCGVMVCHAR